MGKSVNLGRLYSKGAQIGKLIAIDTGACAFLKEGRHLGPLDGRLFGNQATSTSHPWISATFPRASVIGERALPTTCLPNRKWCRVYGLLCELLAPVTPIMLGTGRDYAFDEQKEGRKTLSRSS
jgi:hypothetical protein